jgi:arylsulfatase
MTGCYPMRVAERNNVKNNMPVLHEREPTLGDHLRQRGYATAMFGKWDLAGHGQNPEMGLQMDLLPTHHGFDEYFGTPASNDRWPITTLIEGDAIIENPVNLSRGTTERFTDRALDFIRANQPRPFFLTLATNMPHVELHTSPEFGGITGNGLYADVIREIDHHVGRVLDLIEELSLAAHTVVLFMSDNGPWLSKGEHGGCAEPLRCGKLSTWEGGPRVPCILWGPGRIPEGRVCRELVTSMDVLPTFLAMTGDPLPGDCDVDGDSVQAMLAGDFASADPDRVYGYYFRTHLQAIRQGPWKVILCRPARLPWLKGCSPNPHIPAEDDIPIACPRLYDLRTDIGERHDVAGKHVQIVDRLLARAEEIRLDVGDYDLVGAGARFYDPGPHRPPDQVGGVWQQPKGSEATP